MRTPEGVGVARSLRLRTVRTTNSLCDPCRIVEVIFAVLIKVQLSLSLSWSESSIFKQHRVRAWNLIGHSEAPTAHVTTPAVPSLWTKPWRVISPWWRTGNSSSASGSAPKGSAASLGGSEASSFSQSAAGSAAGVNSDGGGGADFVERGIGVEAEGRGGWRWKEMFEVAWSVLSWAGWGMVGLVKVLQAVLVLATLQTNLTVRIYQQTRACVCPICPQFWFQSITFFRHACVVFVDVSCRGRATYIHRARCAQLFFFSS